MHIRFLILSICSIIFSQSAINAFSFKQLYTTIIPSKMHQEVLYEEYNAGKTNLLTIKNQNGTITIKTEDKNNTILLKAIKKSPEAQDLPNLTFCQKINDQEFIIESQNKNDEQTRNSIDFELIIPKKFACKVQTIEGSITIKQPYAPCIASTHKGQIEIIHPQNTVDATCHQKGNIIFRQPYARAKAQTNKGNIYIYDAQESIVAYAQNGSIEMFAKDIPSTSTVKLSTNYGPIKLHLPSDVNADLQAYTQGGTITSDHFITLKPQTTQLNKNAWKRLQKEIDGTLGSGEAQIKLSSVKSDITLLERKA